MTPVESVHTGSLESVTESFVCQSISRVVVKPWGLLQQTALAPISIHEFPHRERNEYLKLSLSPPYKIRKRLTFGLQRLSQTVKMTESVVRVTP